MRSSLDRMMVVLSKEIIDNLRDKRSFLTSLITTLVTPALLLGLVVVMGKTIFKNVDESELILPVVGAENAPGLIKYLEQNGVVIEPGPDNPQEVIKNGDEDVIIVIPEGYGEDFSASRPAAVQIVMDTSRTSAMRTISKVESLVNSYGTMIGTLRLYARGVNPMILQAVAVEQIDVATPESQAMMFLNMLPFMLTIIIFSGGSYVIIDTTAGERERTSLEPLLINPANRWELVLGKYLAAIPFVTLALAVTLSAFAIGFNLIRVEEFLGVQISISWKTISSIFLICLPVVLFATGLQMIVATATRSFKEAQTYVSLISFLPALPGAFLAFLPSESELWKMMVPSYGQQLLIDQIMRGEGLAQNDIFISAIVTVVAALVLLLIAVRLYKREQIIFGTK